MKSTIKTILLMSLFYLIHTQAAAQLNLVPNPSFEEYDSCPQFMADFYAKYWKSANESTPDYFNSCSINELGVPSNVVGQQYAKSGNAYIGIYNINEDNSIVNDREYVQCELSEDLIQGQEYLVSLYLSLADFSRSACNKIGFYFSTTSIYGNGISNLPQIPQISSKANKIFDDYLNWDSVSGIYKANGGEKFLTIGFFAENSDMLCETIPNLTPLVPFYYFIDDVSVIKMEERTSMPTAFTPNGDNINDTYYPVYFDSSLKVKEFRIYNMWGEIIHNDPLTPWDGTYKGEPQPTNVYSFYVYIDLPVPDNLSQAKSYHKVGSFTLIR